MAEEDSTRELLQKLLGDLYGQAADAQVGKSAAAGSYLIAANDQFLGKITNNRLDQESILNEYGPFGSEYSNTSIFNQYSPYGSEYGQFSLNNPYSTQPPKLFLNGRLVGSVSANEYVPNRIPTSSFLYNLKNNLDSLLRGELPKTEVQSGIQRQDVFIEAADGTFLGSLNPNKFDTQSIFNNFGPHGSKFAQISIFNNFGRYGGKFSPLSPFNSFSTSSPKIMSGDRMVAYLTANKFKNPRVDPNEIFEWAQRNVRKRIN